MGVGGWFVCIDGCASPPLSNPNPTVQPSLPPTKRTCNTRRGVVCLSMTLSATDLLLAWLYPRFTLPDMPFPRVS